MSNTLSSAKGTIKIKTTDNELVPFMPYTNISNVRNLSTGTTLSETVSTLNDRISDAANKGGIKTTYDEPTKENSVDFSAKTLIAWIDYPDVPSDVWQLVVDTRKYGSDGTNAGTAIPFNLYGQSGITLTVDWGDGNVSVLTSSNYVFENSSPSMHLYSTPGVYEIKIKSSNWSNTYIQTDYHISTNYVNYEDALSSKLNFFNYFKNTLIRVESKLPGIKGVRNWGIGSTQNMMLTYDNSLNYLFYDCINLTNIIPTLFDNCSNVTVFSNVFDTCESLVNIPYQLFDNCINAVDMSSCFASCTSLKSVPSHLFDKCTNVTTFGGFLNGCFYDCSSLKSIPQNLFRYNTAVTSFQDCFWECYNLKKFTLYIGSHVVTNASHFVTDSSADMFYREVYVPSNSTTATTFSEINDSIHLVFTSEL